MKNNKLNAWLEKVNRAVKDSRDNFRWNKRLTGAAVLTVSLGVLVLSAGVYNHTTRLIANKTNELVMGADYVEWIRAQITDATESGMETYLAAGDGDLARADGEERTLRDYINQNDIDGMSTLILKEIDRRYEESGEAFSPGQKDQMTRILRSELNTSIESAMTALVDQNISSMTEETYRYVAQYVTKNMEEVLTAAEEQERDLTDLKRQNGQTDSRLAAAEQDLTRISDNAKETENRLKEAQEKQGASEKTIRSLSDDQSTLKAGLEKTNTALDGTKSELEKTNTALDGTKSELEKTRTALDGTKSELEKTNTALNGTKSELDGTKNTLAQTKSDLEKTMTELGGTKSTLDQTKLELETAKGTLARQEADLAGTITTLNGTTRRLSEAETALNDNKQKLHAFETELTEKSDTLSLHTAGIEANREALAAQAVLLQTTRSELATQAALAGALETALAAQADTLTSQAQALENSQERLGNLEGSVVRFDASETLGSLKICVLSAEAYNALQEKAGDTIYLLTE